MTSTDTTDRALGGAREARDNARARLMHYARVDAAVALQREGILADDSPEGLTEALDTLGIILCFTLVIFLVIELIHGRISG